MEPQSPLYNLESLQKAAKNELIILGNQASIKIEELEYSLEEVCRAIVNIKQNEYWKSIPYVDERTRNDISCDVYKTIFQRSSGKTVNLYIKLRLSASGYIFLASFKLK